ncbi:DUF938 domain-containing protein [Gammaproteobacteria bacterium AB-CW1]|uniref:DUF938 domain-containing protein n=1 Tax=Natronospira elongata TaxID=3110268 RepID=A0AAP6MKI8_9GAMM|nr:DUF938 domain-containing protein [Gammaproteobacteria bacterium AB-CW1]
MSELPVSPACERNKGPIQAVLKCVFEQPGVILEIGSGTGQHAVHFARELSHLVWHTSEQPGALSPVQAWLASARLSNLHGPHALDVSAAEWPLSRVEGVFSANTAHIMHWPEVVAMFQGVGRILVAGGRFCLYGPFMRHGEHNSESNRAFDASLRQRDPGMGIRDIEDLNRLAGDAGLSWVAEHAMPANNRLLVWQKAPERPEEGA